MQIFAVYNNVGHVWVGTARDREDAKRQAHSYLGGDKELYVVSPVTQPGDKVRIELRTG